MNITIINDCNLEDKEYFTVSLERGRGVSSKFELADLERNVSITDMDGNTVYYPVYIAVKFRLRCNTRLCMYCDVHVWEI